MLSEAGIGDMGGRANAGGKPWSKFDEGPEGERGIPSVSLCPVSGIMR